MGLTLTASYQEYPESGFTGWCNEIKGIVAQGDTKEIVNKELLKLIRIKFDIVKNEAAKKSADQLAGKSTTAQLAHFQPC